MKCKYTYIFLLILLTFGFYNCSSTKKNKSNVKVVSNNTKPKTTEFLDDETTISSKEKKWVDSIFKKMTFDEKIGQLFMVSAYSNKDSVHFNTIDKLISNYHIGNLIFFQGGPKRQAKLTNRFQSKSKIPMLIAIDGEWGLGMRLDSTYSYPWNMTLGAIQNKKLIEQVGVQVGKHHKRMGIHFNFGPVLDININPKNPIIGFRSFGENTQKVTENASYFIKGLQSEGVIATGKHFPGHGDTDTDSHHALPLINFTKQRLDSIELYPYKKLFKDGLNSVMIAHLDIPSLESKENTPSSVSYNIVTKLLKEELGFKGLIFTDALNMKAASNHKKPGDIDLECFLAGNDMLLCPESVPVAFERLKKAYNDTLFTDDRLNYSVKKILHFKYKAGLNKYKPIELNGINKEINTPEDDALKYKLYENAITVLKNSNTILPIKNFENEKIGYIKIGDAPNTEFLATLKKYTNVDEIIEENLDSLPSELTQFTKIIVGFHKSDRAWKKQDFSSKDILKLQKILQNHNQVILNVLANPYSLMQIKDLNNIKGLVITYQNGDIAQQVSASLLFGAIGAKGKLPVSINSEFKLGMGLETATLNRLGFDAPENVGMNSQILSQIEGVALKAIIGKMTPGAQVLVARKGKVIYQKSFGHHTYSKEIKVKNTDLYDIASLTKIVATLPNLIQAYDQNKFTLNSTLGSILPIAKGSNKDSITMKEFLSHYGKMQAWIPFYKATLDSVTKRPLKKYYRNSFSKDFSIQVAENLFLANSYNDTILNRIIKSKLIDKKEYKYSDFTFILLKEILEKTYNKKLDDLANDNFFNKLGMNSSTFNPLQKFDEAIIPPTENDNYFRYTTLQGYVHDMAAAMQGGVAGHAGLFSNTIDVAKIMQMYLNKGNYGGVNYFSEKAFTDFNTCHYCENGVRRGLGFDKPQLTKEGPTCGCVSKQSFGHTGFTGAITWADPETEIVFVFLSNRTFPDANLPNKLSKENIREDIQAIIQEAIIKN